MGPLADALPWLSDAGASATAILALLALAALLLKTRPVKWAWRTVVKKPVTGWLQVTMQTTIQAELALVHEKLQDVDGKLEDVVADQKGTAQALVTHMDDELAAEAVRGQVMDNWRNEVRDDIGELKKGLGVLHTRLDDTLVALAAGNPEIHPGALDPESPAPPEP